MQVKSLKNSVSISSQPLVEIPPPSKAPQVFAALLVTSASILCVACGIFLGFFGLAICLAVIACLVLVSRYLGSSKRFLVQMSAMKINDKIEPRIFGMLENLCLTAGVQMPEVYIIEDDICVNTLTLKLDGKRSAIVITTGVLLALERIELEAILATQVAMLRRKQDKTVSFMMKSFSLVILFSPSLMPFFIKLTDKNRAALCDQTAVLLTRYPPGLYRAFEKTNSLVTIPKVLDNHFKDLSAPFWFIPLIEAKLNHADFIGILSVTDRMQMLTEM